MNVKSYLELFSPVCHNIFLIETTASLGIGNYPQTVAKTCAMNDGLTSYLDTFSSIHWRSNLYVVRVFDKSLDAKHRDNVHMGGSWYIQLSSTLFKYVY